MSRPSSTRQTVVLLLWLSASCDSDPLIEDYNEAPVAEAKVIVDGQPVELPRDASVVPAVIPYAGEPVTVVLDGTSSHDPDGEIARYRWLSGTRIADAAVPRPWSVDAGVPVPFARSRPPGDDPGWPLDEARPSVRLERGTWAFTLWVADDHGTWSSPDTIRFTIDSAPGSDAGVARSVFLGLDAGLDGGR